jgi:hypothetical protein
MRLRRSVPVLGRSNQLHSSHGKFLNRLLTQVRQLIE